MKLWKHLLLVGASLTTASNIALAHKGAEYVPPQEMPKTLSGFEFIAMGGVATLDADDINITVSEFEIDDLVQSNNSDWSSGTGQLGFGYNYPLMKINSKDDFSWLTNMSTQINFYYLGGDLEGEVYAYQSADWNIANYEMDLSSFRLMLDMALTIASWKDVSWYGIAGVGVAWNNIDYSETINSGYEEYLIPLDLDSQGSAGFAYEVGTGLTYAPTERFSFSFQYLFTVLNDVEIGEVPTYSSEKTEVDISSQALMLGLRVAI